jgi:hypothetical protein
MTAAQVLEQRLARVQAIENKVSFACGVALAVVYFWWRLEYTRVIATYTWMIPFFIGSAIPKLAFSIHEAKLDRQRRELLDGPQIPVPVARALAAPVAPPAPAPPPAPLATPARAPERIEPANPADGPRMLG